MSNNGIFYLDSDHAADKMWLNISAVGDATAAQAALLLGGETSMRRAGLATSQNKKCFHHTACHFLCENPLHAPIVPMHTTCTASTLTSGA